MSDVLVVASKVKKFIKEKGEMSTAANVMPKLTAIIEAECEKAIAAAQGDKRKTVMDRDFDSQ